MHFTLQLITYATDSHKLLRDLLIVLQILDHCQLPVSIFQTPLASTPVYYNPSEKHIYIAKGNYP